MKYNKAEREASEKEERPRQLSRFQMGRSDLTQQASACLTLAGLGFSFCSWCHNRSGSWREDWKWTGNEVLWDKCSKL